MSVYLQKDLYKFSTIKTKKMPSTRRKTTAWICKPLHDRLTYFSFWLTDWLLGSSETHSYWQSRLRWQLKSFLGNVWQLVGLRLDDASELVAKELKWSESAGQAVSDVIGNILILPNSGSLNRDGRERNVARNATYSLQSLIPMLAVALTLTYSQKWDVMTWLLLHTINRTIIENVYFVCISLVFLVGQTRAIWCSFHFSREFVIPRSRCSFHLIPVCLLISRFRRN